MNQNQETSERFDVQNDTINIKLQNNIEICVPDSINNLVAYVLKEQERWLDDESEFINKLINKQSKVIDIASNYGIYSIPISKVADKVWVFESNPVTNGCLSQSIQLNELSNIAIIDLPLFGAASQDDAPERIDSTSSCSLDPYVRKFGFSDIDFLRINISEDVSKLVSQSNKFFILNSPLVMCGRHHDDEENLKLVEIFTRIHYKPYCLIPGLNILAPIDDISAIDSYLTNIFFCNTVVAEKLNQRELLCLELTDVSKLLEENTDTWEEYAKNATYTQPVLELWNSRTSEEFKSSNTDEWPDYKKALVYFTIAHNEVYSVNIRVSCLYKSFQLLTATIEDNPSFSKLLTMARLSAELGLKDSAIQSLKVLLELLCSDQPISADEPFIPVHAVFDSINPEERLGEWCFSSIFQTYSWFRSYSTFFSMEKELQTFEEFKGTPFMQPRTERARQLLKIKLGKQIVPEHTKLLTLPTELNLNPQFWS